MAWTAPVTRATGYVVLAADWNNEHVGDLQYLHGDAGSIGLNSAALGPGFLVNTNSGGGGVGYSAGAGGTVTQATSRNTTVTINKLCGSIVTNGTLLANGASALFAVNNIMVDSNGPDMVLLTVTNNPVTGPAMIPSVVTIGVSSFAIGYANTSGAATTQVLVIMFAVLKAVQT